MSTNPHTEKAHQALSSLKELASTTDGWTFVQEKEGVKLYNKTVEGNPIPLVRGDIVVEGDQYTPQQLLAVCTFPGCRKIFVHPIVCLGDEKYDTSEIKQLYSRYESLFWTKLKTPWPISPRDIAGTSLRETSENGGYIVLTSVTDPQIPENSGVVRANLILSGWKVEKTSTGISIVYITQIDLAGSIPTSFLKTVQQQVPLCAGKVVKYIKDFGYPPICLDATVTFKKESFDHGKREYTVELDGEGEAKWSYSKQMYPGGVRVHVSGNGSVEVVNHEIILKGVNGPATVTITKS
ncbi:Bet v1-like protein [Rhizopus microsporus]|uniref:Bet v1-like protein n=1 Tax=Rhizopus microsporus TaxID=58291 RepID=A0A1X0S3P6_RHIZD|nr:Bet v1-like protein [Rhizopus microsporus]